MRRIEAAYTTPEVDALVTSDNPLTEDPTTIAKPVEAARSAAMHVAIDRKRAIARAIERASPGRPRLVAGKWHEDFQIVATERPFDHRVEARSSLAQRRRR